MAARRFVVLMLLPTLMALALILPAHRSATAQGAPPASPDTKSTLPSGTEVLNNALKAVGGKKALDGVRSSRIVTTIESPMGNSIMELFWMRSGACLMRTTIAGKGVVEEGTDGKVAWGTNPTTGKLEKIKGSGLPVPLTDRTNLHLMIPRMIEGYASAKTIERRAYAGRPCYVVHLSQPKIVELGDRTAYFDVETHLPVGVEMTAKTPNGERKVTQQVGSWIERDGIKIVERLVIEGTNQPRSTMRVTSVEFNRLQPRVVSAPDSLATAP